MLTKIPNYRKRSMVMTYCQLTSAGRYMLAMRMKMEEPDEERNKPF